ncbi:sigma-54 interaction domain-containing protein [Intestinibacter sp.]
MNNDIYKQLLDIIIENVDAGIHFIDKNGKTYIYNSSMEKLEQITKNEISKNSFFDMVEKLKIENSTMLSVLKSGKMIKDNMQRYVNKNGKEITTINTTIPIYENQNLIGALEVAKDITTIQQLSEKVNKVENINTHEKKNKKGYRFSDIVGNSYLIKKSIEKSKKAAKSDASILIYGETGTGKELISQSIHYASKRKDKPFIAQNCASLPGTLLEGILFGTTKGGFTGAIDRPGLFEQADGGTLLLDEINSMPIELQAKLLRVLQEGYVRRVGGTKDIFVDVRIIATTNENPKEILENKKIREDLYYRLNVIYIEIPPLREREDDILLLSYNFIDKYNKKLNKNINNISREACKELINHYWQGNVRELENTIYSTLSMMNEDEHEIKKHMLNINKYYTIAEYNIKKQDENFLQNLKQRPLDWIIAEIEEQYIFEALENSGYNTTKAAMILGISRQNLQYKMKKYNIRKR